jgi:DHA2 family multidrug resistance protein-like MFS transporter
MLIYSLGIGPVITLATDMIVGAAPPERAGAAAALSETSSEFGGALGIAILGSIGTAIYRSKIAVGMPEKISQKMAEEATDTLGGAIAVASQLPSELGRSLIQTANASFVTGMQLNAWIAAAIAGVLAVLSVIVLRKK